MPVHRSVTPQITTNLYRQEASPREREELGLKTHHNLDVQLVGCKIVNVEWDEDSDEILIEFRTHDDVEHDKQHDHQFTRWVHGGFVEGGTRYTRECVWGRCPKQEVVVIPHE